MPPSRGSRITENYELDWFSQIYGNGMIRDWKVDPTSSDIRTTRQQLCRQQIWPRNGEFASLHMYIYIYISMWSNFFMTTQGLWQEKSAGTTSFTMFYPKIQLFPSRIIPRKTTGRSCKHGFYKSSIPGLYHIHHVYYWVITPAYQNYYSNRLHPGGRGTTGSW